MQDVEMINNRLQVGRRGANGEGCPDTADMIVGALEDCLGTTRFQHMHLATVGFTFTKEGSQRIQQNRLELSSITDHGVGLDQHVRGV